MALFTDAQLADLRKEYATIKTIDPCMPTYDRITGMLDAMADDVLVQVAKAEIKWLSILARTRCIRRKLPL